MSQLSHNPVARVAAWWRERHPAARFVVGFLVGLGCVSLVFTWLSVRFHTQMVEYMGLTAEAVGGLLRLFALSPAVEGRFITTAGFSVEIVEECTGAYEVVIFLAALIAYPSRWRHKLYGLLFGVPTLIAINIIRMVALVVIGHHSPGSFEFWHVYFWQVTLIIMIVTVWVLWIKIFGVRDARA